MTDHESYTASGRLWIAEASSLLRAGLPLIGAFLAQMAINVTDSAMIGWLGPKQLSASVIAFTVFFVFWDIGLGLLQAVIPIASNAFGRGDKEGVRRAAQMGIWVALIYTSLAMAALWNADQWLLYLGQSRETVALASEYLLILQWSMYPSLLAIALRCFLISIQRTKVTLWATIIAAITNAVLDYALIFGKFGLPALGLSGAAYATIGTTFAAVLIMAGYILKGDLARSFQIFHRLWRFDAITFVKTLKIGVPIALTLAAEMSVMTFCAFMMGWLGTIQLAAHGIIMQIATTAFTIPFALSQVTSARIGKALGARDYESARRASWVAIQLSIFFAALTGFVFASVPEALVSAFLDSRKEDSLPVVVVGVAMLYIVAGYQIANNVQIVANGALRGLEDTKTPMWLVCFSQWGVGVTVSYISAFHLGLGASGIWLGIACGLASSACLLSMRLHMKLKQLNEP